MICIINFGSQKTAAIAETVQSLGFECTVIDWTEFKYDDFKNANAFILSGAPVLLSQTSPQPYLDKIRFIQTTVIPVLGICFGHQLIGLLHGANVFMGEPVRTVVSMDILVQNSLFAGLPERPLFAEDHTEGITLPAEFFHLAQSGKYKVEAMKHQSKNSYGVQFHPEVSGENGKTLLFNFLQLVK